MAACTALGRKGVKSSPSASARWPSMPFVYSLNSVLSSAMPCTGGYSAEHSNTFIACWLPQCTIVKVNHCTSV